MATLAELETTVQNIAHRLGILEDLLSTDWENIKSILDMLQNYPPWNNIPDMPPPLLNKYTQIRLTRCQKESLEHGGRWEAASNLKGMLVLAVNDLPPSLYYCTGTEWRRVNSMLELDGSAYGYITDATPLAYNKGGTVQIPLVKLMNMQNQNNVVIGTLISDKYHAVGIIIDILLPELNLEITEDTAVIVTWINETDGTNLYLNDNGGQ
jgi:hypothetical protein